MTKPLVAGEHGFKAMKLFRMQFLDLKKLQSGDRDGNSGLGDIDHDWRNATRVPNWDPCPNHPLSRTINSALALVVPYPFTCQCHRIAGLNDVLAGGSASPDDRGYGRDYDSSHGLSLLG